MCLIKLSKKLFFDLLLILMEFAVTGKKVEKILKETADKRYLRNRTIKPLLLSVEDLLKQAFINQGKGTEIIICFDETIDGTKK